jgi:4-amino-4-deoxy-L-arabinose transferase-like glycosyltransferase
MSRSFLIGCLIFLVLASLVYPEYRYHMNPDGTSYLTLAQKYTQGRWFEAISGHWAPLYIWILALLEAIGFSPMLSVAIANIGSGIFILWALDRLAIQIGIGFARRLAILSVSCLYCLFIAIAVITPDPLVTAFLTCYLVLVAEGRCFTQIRYACLTGLIGGLAYLAKPYALYFILLHLFAVSLLRIEGWKTARRTGLRVACVYGVMLLVSLPWIACISWKYGRLTTSTAGDFSFRVMGPKGRGPYVVFAGLAPPPNSNAISYWEDPSTLDVPRWSPFESSDSFRYYLGVISNNIRDAVIWCIQASLLTLPLLGVGIWKWLRKGDLCAGLLVLTIVLYPAGYLLQHIDGRYLWPIALWSLVLGMHLVPDGRNSATAGFLLCASFALYPFFQMRAYSTGQNEHSIGEKLKNDYHLQGNVASSSRWVDSLAVSFYAGIRYYGVPAPGSTALMRQELQRNQIRYLLVWSGDADNPDLRAGMPEINPGGLPGLRVFGARP